VRRNGPDSTTLYKAISAGTTFPSWELSVQMIDHGRPGQVRPSPRSMRPRWWPEKLVPSVTVGKDDAEPLPPTSSKRQRQSAFSPGDLVPGLRLRRDRLAARPDVLYFATQRHRGRQHSPLAINGRWRRETPTGQSVGSFAARGTSLTSI